MSRTKIYRANSPTIYACVMNLNFIAYIVKINLRWSLHYIFNHARWCMRGKTLKHKPNLSIKPFPLNPLNFSPIGNNCQNGWRILEGQYSKSSSPRCAFLIKWVKPYALIQSRIFGESQTILWGSKIAKKNHKVKQASTSEANKQSKDPKNQLDKRGYYDRSQRAF